MSGDSRVNATIAEFLLHQASDAKELAQRAKLLAALTQLPPQRRNELAEAVDMVCRSIAAHGGKLIGRGTPPVVLEGDWAWQTVGVLSFPSMEAAEGFWHSSEYAEVKKLREGNSQFQVVLAPATG